MLRPALAVHDVLDDLRGEALALPDVLRVLLGVVLEIGIHDADRGQRAAVGVGEELLRTPDVPHVAADAERVDVRGELHVLAQLSQGGGVQRPQRAQPALQHPAPVPQRRPEPGLAPGQRVVVHPRDAVCAELVEDGPVGRVVGHVHRQVVDEPVGGPGDEEPAVGEGRAQAGGEPPVGQRERPGQSVVEGQVALGPVAHGPGGVLVRDQLLGRGHEPVELAVRPLQVGGVPALRGGVRHLDRAVQVVGGNRLTLGPGVGDLRLAVRAERETLTPARQHAQVVVVGVVLHHQHDDVLDLRQQVSAGRLVRRRELSGPVAGNTAGDPLQLTLLEPVPHVRHLWSMTALPAVVLADAAQRGSLPPPTQAMAAHSRVALTYLSAWQNRPQGSTRTSGSSEVPGPGAGPAEPRPPARGSCP